ncbi:MAG: type IV pili twitching motility protein PilT, partial [Acidihalobacter sp.]
MARIDALLNQLLDSKGSDLHLIAGQKLRMRINGELEAVGPERVEAEDVAAMAGEILGNRARQQLEREDGADFAYELDQRARFRVNLFRHIGGLGMIMRAIPAEAMMAGS